MKSNPDAKSTNLSALKNLLWIVLALLAVLTALFVKSFEPGQVLFSNDAFLGIISAKWFELPESLRGAWLDTNLVGIYPGSTLLDFTYGVHWLLSPVGYSKFYTPISLLLLGLSAWLFCRQLGFHPRVCLLVGLAAALNGNYFSTACWGLASRSLTLAATFLALAALVSSPARHFWIKIILAGFAVGMGIMEGADNGAIFSLYVAAFVVFQTWVTEKTALATIKKGIPRVVLVALFAGWLGSQHLTSLITTQIKGIVGTQQDEKSKAERWDFATQWSLPKTEILRVIIPGLYGYRMDTPDGGNYWGGVGQTPGWEVHHQGTPRHSGSGEYAGVLVVLVAIWAAAQSFRRQGSIFTDTERRMIWFWIAVAVASALFAFGRHAVFYRVLYALPYFSTIRNPIKFLQPLHLALLVLFAYGLHGMSKRYLETASATTQSAWNHFKSWWSKTVGFEKRWAMASIAAVILSLLLLVIYGGSQSDLAARLTANGFDLAQAKLIAAFSVGEVGWFVLFLLVAVGLVTLMQSGFFAGSRAWSAGVLLGLLLVSDLCRADKPWINYYDYQKTYAPNQILDLLRDKPYEHRVATSLAPLTGRNLVNEQGSLLAAMLNEWLQHQFQFYNIQSLDITYLARTPELDDAFLKNFRPKSNAELFLYGRLWQLSNTRYVLGMAGFLDLLNQQIDPQQHSFGTRALFDIVPKSGITRATSIDDLTVTLSDKGPFALFEFTNALPRAKLYSRWQVSTNDEATLRELANPAFDPSQTVLVPTPLPAPAAATPGKESTNSVSYVSYAPKKILLKSQADGAAVLLLNDRFDPNWKVTVDGKPQELLRCNYIMRGVRLAPGQHVIEFRFEPSMTGLYLSLSAIVLGVGLVGFLCVAGRPKEAQKAPASSAPKPTQK